MPKEELQTHWEIYSTLSSDEKRVYSKEIKTRHGISNYKWITFVAKMNKQKSRAKARESK
jgi:hypothetical protein